MIDPGTGMVIGGLAIAGRDLLVKLLGPTAEDMGEDLKSFVKRRKKNVERIIEKAGRKLGPKLEEPGQVPPRVLKEVFDEGSYCDDELSAEYFAGVLASSRSTDGKDDRAKPLMSLLSRLSSYEIRAHYIFYLTTRGLYGGVSSSHASKTSMRGMNVFIPTLGLLNQMGLNTLDMQLSKRNGCIIQDALYGLAREQLIDDGFAFCPSKILKEAGYTNIEKSENGVAIAPSGAGMQLFLYAHGMQDTPIRMYLDPAVQYDSISEVSMPKGARKTILDRPMWA